MPRKFPENETRHERHTFEQEDDIERDIRNRQRTAESPSELASYRYSKDYDRLLYSSGFRRLGGVTQVVTSSEVGAFHNRLTHSLKVAQTAHLICGNLQRTAGEELTSIIKKFGGLHPKVVRAASRAHDLGHPPLGHIGEKALQDLAANPTRFISDYPADTPLTDSFEGNAQSFRIVTKLSFRKEWEEGKDNPALNLTRATLRALSKYPWTSESSVREETRNKFGAYHLLDRKILEWAMEGIDERETRIYDSVQRVERRSIEAQVMDWADDIAYAVHDVEDFFRAGLVPLHELGDNIEMLHRLAELALDSLDGRVPQGLNAPKVVDMVLGHTSKYYQSLPNRPYDGSAAQRNDLHKLSSSIIKKITRDVQINNEGVLVPPLEDLLLIEVLKKLTRFFVIDRPALGSAQRGQRVVLLELVSHLWQWVNDSKIDTEGNHLPARLQDYMKIDKPDDSEMHDERIKASYTLRAVIDYVSSLTDDQAFAYHRRLTSGHPSSMLDTWLFL